MKFPRRVRTRYVKEILDQLLATTVFTNKELIKKMGMSPSTFYDIQAISHDYTRTINLKRIARLMDMQVLFSGDKPVIVPKATVKKFLTKEQFAAIIESLNPTTKDLDMMRSIIEDLSARRAKEGIQQKSVN